MPARDEARARWTELRAGWRNLAAATLGLGFGIASFTPVSSLFFRALEREFGWSKVASTGALIALPITALVLPLAGWLIDRFGVRFVAGASAACAVASYVWLGRMSGSVPEFYLAVAVLNILGCATGPVAYTRLVAAQFRISRGLALAAAQFGIAFISAIMPQLLGAVIAVSGWRMGFLLYAGTSAFGALCAQVLMRPVSAVDSVALSDGMTPRQALAIPAFWILGLAILAISSAAFGLVAQFQSVFADRQLTLGTATALLSLLAVSVMVSRLIVGRLLDRPRPTRAAAGVMVLAASGAALLASSATGLITTVVAVALVGFSIGAELDLLAFFCARQFGIRHYAAIYGILSAFFYSGIAVGGIGYAITRTATGSYKAALLGSAVLLMISALLFIALGRQRQPVSGAHT